MDEPAQDAPDDQADSIDRWTKVWAERRVFEADGLVEDTGDDRPRRYIVTMFPYPSGDLHMGHAEVYSIGDALSRFSRLRGHNVLQPIGWDSFGLPAENAALRMDRDPREWTYDNIEVQAEGFRRLGVSFDWRTRLHTSDPDYYRWNQWLFLKMYEQGVAYRGEATVNWCPKDNTVLANEQVIQGRCERCGTLVEGRSLTQWFFRITDYAQRLLDHMDHMPHWPDDILAMQRNWIGRSEGASVDFEVEGRDEPLTVYTTRPDTLFGATFMVVAADAPIAAELCADEQRAEFEAYQARTWAASDIDRLSTERAMTGVPLGRHAVNPVNGERIPMYASDYVLAGYGTGAIMAVPAHDQRDLDFARAMGLPVRTVIDTGEPDPAETWVATTGDGTMISSGDYTGMGSSDGNEAIVADLDARGLGRAAVNYRLRDWLVSRQRYWGTPFPIVHCEACGEVPVPYEDLPVVLPTEGYDLRASEGMAPLDSAEDWWRVDCPRCGQPARRDTDTMDTFVDSAWYFLRYPNPDYVDGPFDPRGVERWLPVTEYIGGKEHAILHLMYTRFFTMFLHDEGMLHFEEPFDRLTNQGQVIMGGAAMSKSLGNLVDLQDQIARFGPDAVRVTMLFAGPPEDDIDWAHVSPAGSVKWLARVRRVADDVGAASPAGGDGHLETRKGVHRLVHEITELMETRRLNVAIARSMELTSLLRKAVDGDPGPADAAVLEGAEALARIISCFAPFTAEDAWAALGREASVAEHGWPEVDEAMLVVESVTCVVQVDGKVRDRLDVPPEIGEDELRELAVASAGVQRQLDGKSIKRVVVRPPNLVNVVIG